MKKLKDIILEKLVINKNTKIRNTFIDTILRFIYAEPEDADDDVANEITNWVKNVAHLTILSTLDTLEKYGVIDPDNRYFEKDLREDFENDNSYTNFYENVFIHI